MEELVSIVIPTYGRVQELYNAIESVLQQTYKKIEVIVVDDNKNNSELRKEIKKKIKSDYPQIIFIQNHENLGGSKSRNRGIEHSNGKYIAFLDDDDIFYKNSATRFIMKSYDMLKLKSK